MSKGYNEVSNQIIAVKNKDHVLSFYAGLQPASVERFAELVSGKIKVAINDFSKGKGDRAVYGFYNLDLKDVNYLYTRAKYFRLPTPFSGTKIMGTSPEESGRYKGYCKAFRIVITRHDDRNSPWNITIKNGYALAAPGAVKGSFYEKAGSFQQITEVYFNLTDIDFLECMEKSMTYIREFTSLSANHLIPEGLKALNEVNQRSTYNTSYKTPAPANETKKPEVPKVESQTTKNLPELHPTPILIQSPFQALDNGKAVAQCLIKGKKFNIFFESINAELIDAQVAQKTITVDLYMDSERRFWCHGVSSAN